MKNSEMLVLRTELKQINIERANSGFLFEKTPQFKTI